MFCKINFGCVIPHMLSTLLLFRWSKHSYIYIFEVLVYIKLQVYLQLMPISHGKLRFSSFCSLFQTTVNGHQPYKLKGYMSFFFTFTKIWLTGINRINSKVIYLLFTFLYKTTVNGRQQCNLMVICSLLTFIKVWLMGVICVIWKVISFFLLFQKYG